MPLNLTKSQKEELSHHDWRVFTSDSITQRAIADHLAESGSGSDSKTDIFYSGEQLPVFKVPFRVVVFLEENKVNVPYSFTSYHRKNRSEGWKVWRGGKKTPVEKLVKEFPLTGKELKSMALRKKQRGNIIRKSALMSR